MVYDPNFRAADYQPFEDDLPAVQRERSAIVTAWPATEPTVPSAPTSRLSGTLGEADGPAAWLRRRPRGPTSFSAN